MKTPKTIFDFNQHSWFAKAQLLQRLKLDVSAACTELGFEQANKCELFLEDDQLQIKSSASYIARLRQIEPELLTKLELKLWPISRLRLVTIRNAQSLNEHLRHKEWINPNIVRYGKRVAPSEVQRAFLKIDNKS